MANDINKALTHSELAEKMGVSTDYLRKYIRKYLPSIKTKQEKRKRIFSPREINRILKHYGV